MTEKSKKIVILATGGTIAGTAASSADHTGYRAAQIGVVQLLATIAGLPEALQGCELVSEQVAQIDSKDMDFSTMARLARRCVDCLEQSDVTGVVVTHGTDTLEETAWFLQLCLPPALLATKSVVLTCAMRPATSCESDGPRNVCDAVRVVLDGQARGVLCVCAGDVHHAQYVQKLHSHALNAFASGDAGWAARVTGSKVIWQAVTSDFYIRNMPIDQWGIAQAAMHCIADTAPWPRVEILLNYAQANGAMVRSLLAGRAHEAQPVQGIVVAGTGNGSLSADLHAALLEAQSQGIHVVRASRCAWGGVSATARDELPCTALSAVKARVLMVLQLAAGQQAAKAID